MKKIQSYHKILLITWHFEWVQHAVMYLWSINFKFSCIITTFVSLKLLSLCWMSQINMYLGIGGTRIQCGHFQWKCRNWYFIMFLILGLLWQRHWHKPIASVAPRERGSIDILAIARSACRKSWHQWQEVLYDTTYWQENTWDELS
jgi:hypothetical protein